MLDVNLGGEKVFPWPTRWTPRCAVHLRHRLRRAGLDARLRRRPVLAKPLPDGRIARRAGPARRRLSAAPMHGHRPARIGRRRSGAHELRSSAGSRPPRKAVPCIPRVSREHAARAGNGHPPVLCCRSNRGYNGRRVPRACGGGITAIVLGLIGLYSRRAASGWPPLGARPTTWWRVRAAGHGRPAAPAPECRGLDVCGIAARHDGVGRLGSGPDILVTGAARRRSRPARALAAGPAVHRPAAGTGTARRCGSAGSFAGDCRDRRRRLVDVRREREPRHAAGDRVRDGGRRLRRVTKPDADWRAYGRTQFGDRYSPLTQITPANVGNLKVAWTFRTGDLPGPNDPVETTIEVTPIKVDDTVYLCSPHQIVCSRSTPRPARCAGSTIRMLQDNPTFQHLTCRGVVLSRDRSRAPSTSRRRAGAGRLPARASSCPPTTAG